MTNARERRFHWVLVSAVLIVALVVVVRVTYDALASPVRPTPLQVTPDDRARTGHGRTTASSNGSCTGRCPGPNATNGASCPAAGQCAEPWAPHLSATTGSRLPSSAFTARRQWTDGGLPYFGGLQMDLDFQRAYGRDYLRYFGPADAGPCRSRSRSRSVATSPGAFTLAEHPPDVRPSDHDDGLA